jgi:hypothetical protein
MLYKQALQPLKDTHVKNKAEKLAKQLYGEFKSRFLPDKDTTVQNRFNRFITLANAALTIKMELLISDKNYEIKLFGEDDQYDEVYMQMGKDYHSSDDTPKPHQKITRLIFPALIQYDWQPAAALEAARLRSVTFFPSPSSKRENPALISKALVTTKVFPKIPLKRALPVPT